MLVIGVGAVAVLSLGSAVAHAQEAVPTLTSASASAGGGDDISGAGCAARVSVQIQFDGAVLVTTRSTLTGRYSAHLIIPVSAVPGSHRITVVCTATTGRETTSTAVSVTLPRTGIDAAEPTAVALTLLLIGGTFALIRRRRIT
jgi:LPXTG-motif cell wall-anchored protein